jgi:hypothetical protein
MSNQFFTSDLFEPGGILGAQYAMINLLNPAYKAAGVNAQVHRAIACYDGGSQPETAVQDSMIGLSTLPTATNVMGDAQVSSLNIVYVCDALDDNGAGIGYKIVNAAEVIQAFKAGGIEAMQAAINATNNPV